MNNFFVLGFGLFIAFINLGNPLIIPTFNVTVFLYLFFFLTFIYFIYSKISSGRISKIETACIIMLSTFFPSVFLSEFFEVALFKFIIFSMGILGMCTFFEKFRRTPSYYKEKVFKNLISFQRIILVASLLILIAGLGYPRNPTGFAGILSHPQSFGVLITFIGIIEFYIFLSSKKIIKPSLYLVLAIFLMVLTESRTALLSFFFTALYLVFNAIVNLKIHKSRISTIKVSAIFIGSIAFVPLLLDEISIFLIKNANTFLVLEALERGRGSFVYASAQNFFENPFFGIGFQISNGLYGHYPMIIETEPYFGLPISASIEKGVFIAGAIEEVGLIGFLGFVFFIFSNYQKGGRSTFGSCLIIGALLISFGEAAFFSLGGVGFIKWWMIFFGYSAGSLIDRNYSSILNVDHE